jgi:CRISPR-associated protein GSU0053 (Cas_GSU0053)
MHGTAGTRRGARTAGIVYPPTYPRKDGTPMYSFLPVLDDGVVKHGVYLDTPASSINRMEIELAKQIHNNDPVLSKINRIALHVGADRVLYDFEIPNRLVDAVVKTAKLPDGTSIMTSKEYLAAVRSTLADLRPLTCLSPATAAFGGWDSTRVGGMAQKAMAEAAIIGILADQDRDPGMDFCGGLRIDPVSGHNGYDLTDEVAKKLVADWVDPTAGVKGILAGKSKAKGKTADTADTASGGEGKGSGGSSDTRAANLVLGPLPYAQRAGVVCSKIFRENVIELAYARTMKFGGTPEQDAHACALLVAMVLVGDALARRDGLSLRAGCHLRATDAGTMTLNHNGGRVEEFAPLTVEQATAVLKTLLDSSKQTQLTWDGTQFDADVSSVLLSALKEEQRVRGMETGGRPDRVVLSRAVRRA